jgi:hypothetical protein
MFFIPPPSRGRRPPQRPEGGRWDKIEPSHRPSDPPSGPWPDLLPREGGGIGGA